MIGAIVALYVNSYKITQHNVKSCPPITSIQPSQNETCVTTSVYVGHECFDVPREKPFGGKYDQKYCKQIDECRILVKCHGERKK